MDGHPPVGHSGNMGNGWHPHVHWVHWIHTLYTLGILDRHTVYIGYILDRHTSPPYTLGTYNGLPSPPLYGVAPIVEWCSTHIRYIRIRPRMHQDRCKAHQIMLHYIHPTHQIDGQTRKGHVKGSPDNILSSAKYIFTIKGGHALYILEFHEFRFVLFSDRRKFWFF